MPHIYSRFHKEKNHCVSENMREEKNIFENGCMSHEILPA